MRLYLMATPTGIEPVLSDVTDRCFNQLNYGAIWQRYFGIEPRSGGLEPPVLAVTLYLHIS